jgi:hypothetical protein
MKVIMLPDKKYYMIKRKMHRNNYKITTYKFFLPNKETVY